MLNPCTWNHFLMLFCFILFDDRCTSWNFLSNFLKLCFDLYILFDGKLSLQTKLCSAISSFVMVLNKSEWNKILLRELYEKNNCLNLFHKLSLFISKMIRNLFLVFIYTQFIPKICVKYVHMELLFYAFCYFLVLYLSSSSLQLRLWFIIQYSILIVLLESIIPIRMSFKCCSFIIVLLFWWKLSCMFCAIWEGMKKGWPIFKVSNVNPADESLGVIVFSFLIPTFSTTTQSSQINSGASSLFIYIIHSTDWNPITNIRFSSPSLLSYIIVIF